MYRGLAPPGSPGRKQNQAAIFLRGRVEVEGSSKALNSVWGQWAAKTGRASKESQRDT